MPLHAVSDIDDAIAATKELFTPLDVRQWLRLAFVAFFIGGGSASTGFQNVNGFQNGGDGGVNVPGGVPPEAGEVLGGVSIALVAGIVALVLVLALLFSIVGAVMEFVFAQSLISTEVRVRRSFRENLGNGLRLFGFRLLVGVVALLLLGGVAVLVALAAFGGNLAAAGPGAILGSLGLVFVVFVPAVVVFGLVNGFTNSFVVPLMVTENLKLLAAWRRLWSSITGAPTQYLAFVGVSFVLGIATGIVGGILTLLGVAIVAIPLGIVGLVAWFGLGPGGVLAGLLIGLVAVVFVLAVFLISAMVTAPLLSFRRYFAMLVLGDVDSGLDPIPVVRESVRPAQ